MPRIDPIRTRMTILSINWLKTNFDFGAVDHCPLVAHLHHQQVHALLGLALAGLVAWDVGEVLRAAVALLLHFLQRGFE